MNGQFGKQLLQFAFVTDNFRAITILKCWLKKFESNVFGDDISDSDLECFSTAGMPGANKLLQFVADRKNFIRVLMDLGTKFRQDQATPLLLKKFLAYRAFQVLDLSRHRGSGKMQGLRRGRNGARLDRHPKVKKVMIVEPFHSCRIRFVGEGLQMIFTIISYIRPIEDAF